MRFSIVATALLASADAALAAPHHPGKGDNLNALAQRRGKLWFGTAADIPHTPETTHAGYLDILKTQFGEVTPANALKVLSTWKSP